MSTRDLTINIQCVRDGNMELNYEQNLEQLALRRQAQMVLMM